MFPKWSLNFFLLLFLGGGGVRGGGKGHQNFDFFGKKITLIIFPWVSKQQPCILSINGSGLSCHVKGAPTDLPITLLVFRSRWWGALLMGLGNWDPPLSPPSTRVEIFRRTCLQSRLQTSPPPIKSHKQSFRTLGKFRPPSSPQFVS